MLASEHISLVLNGSISMQNLASFVVYIKKGSLQSFSKETEIDSY